MQGAQGVQFSDQTETFLRHDTRRVAQKVLTFNRKVDRLRLSPFGQSADSSMPKRVA